MRPTVLLFAASVMMLSYQNGMATYPSASANDEKRIYLSVYSMDTWTDVSTSDIGLYSFSTDRYDPRLEKLDCNIDASGGGTMTEDYYFCTSELNFGFGPEISHYFFKPEVWRQVSQLYGTEGAVATDLAYDHTTYKIYGCFQTDPSLGEEAGGFVFGTLDETSGNRTAIASLDQPWIALGCTRDGRLYAVEMDGTLLKVEKNGNITALGELGIKGENRSTGAFDTATGIFYVVTTSTIASEDHGDGTSHGIAKSDLYAVDVENAKATFLYNFEGGEVVGGMYIPGPLSADEAPEEVTDFNVSFPDGSLEGTVRFTVPSRNFAGSPLSGDVKYLVRANGSLLGEGVAQPGESVQFSCKVNEAGEYDVVCEISNEFGRGPKTRRSLWIGHDIPLPASNLELSYRDGNFILSWERTPGSVHQGYIDNELVTYDITRLPDNVIVAEDLKTESFTDPVALPENLVTYSYRVDMKYDGMNVSTLNSVKYRLGSVALPYELDFDDEDSFNELTIIDANGDKAEWYREEYWYIEALDLECGAAVYPYSSFNKADDWLILPPVSLKTGYEYELKFQVSTVSPDYTEALEVRYSSAPTAEAMNNVLSVEKEYNIYDPADERIIISPDSNGIYYIGFHACSSADGGGIGLRNISLSELHGSGIGDVNTLTDRSVRFFNLQGIELDNRPSNGMYIEYGPDGKAIKRLGTR